MHTNQYLNFHSHHPLHQKLGVIKLIRTLFDRNDNLVTQEHDRKAEEMEVTSALSGCGYPTWAFHRVKEKMERAQHLRETEEEG